MAFSLSAEQERELGRILARYPNKMAATIPVLHLCQSANENWVSDDVIQFVADKLEVGTAHVKGVVTFYTLFNQSKPGKHQVWVCRTLSCALRGSEGLLHHCEKRLKIHAGETTPENWMDDPGFALTQGNWEEKANDMWGCKLFAEGGESLERTVDSHIKNLRKKIAKELPDRRRDLPRVELAEDVELRIGRETERLGVGAHLE